MGSLAVEQPLWLISSPQCRRLQTNRSPVESPPIAKKFLRSSCSQKPQQHCSSLLDIVDTACNDSRSILKSVDCNRSKSWHAGQTARRVDFDQNVVVVIYDRADGEFVCCANQQLNIQPKDRRQFVSRTLLARLHSNKTTSSSSSLVEDSASGQHCTPLTASGGRSAEIVKPSSTAPPAGRPLPSVQSLVDNSSPPIANIDFTFHEDRGGHLWLSFTVPLGRGVAAGDALVKANIAGNKVRVLGTRTVKCDAATPVRQAFATRYALPMEVDPYAISARMDSAGNLFVEAPVKMTDERRRQTTVTANCTAIAN